MFDRHEFWKNGSLEGGKPRAVGSGSRGVGVRYPGRELVKLGRFTLAALAAMAFLLVVNVVLHPIVFPEGTLGLYRYERANPLALYHVLSMLATSILLAFIFPIGYRGRIPWAEGMRFGMLMGVLVKLPWSLDVYAASDFQFSLLLTAVLWTVITYGIAGGLVGAAYGKSLKSG